jgi:hypothetical protein
MRRVCAQCDLEMVADDGPEPETSHGLCGDCAQRLMRNALLPANANWEPAVGAALTSLIDTSPGS